MARLKMSLGGYFPPLLGQTLAQYNPKLTRISPLFAGSGFVSDRYDISAAYHGLNGSISSFL